MNRNSMLAGLLAVLSSQAGDSYKPERVTGQRFRRHARRVRLAGSKAKDAFRGWCGVRRARKNVVVGETKSERANRLIRVALGARIRLERILADEKAMFEQGRP